MCFLFSFVSWIAKVCGEMDANESEEVLDVKFLDKQSRTIGTYGLETMAKLVSFKVLIVGCGGVGVEAAKNLCLAGVNTLTLYDPKQASALDMGVNFCVTHEAVENRRCIAEVTAAYIRELNPFTRVCVIDDLTEEVVARHHALIVTSASPDLSMAFLSKWNQFCRSRSPSVSFLLALQFGIFGSVFVDHGSSFVVKDADGRPKLQKSILEISSRVDKDGESYSLIRFETPEGQTPGALHDYTTIKLSEVQGLLKSDGSTDISHTLLSGVVCPADPRNTVRVYPSLEEQGFSPYVTGGFLHEEKETTALQFHSLQHAIHSPGTFTPVSPMMDNSEETRSHILLHALLKFADAHQGTLPKLHCPEDAKEVVRLAHSVIDENKLLPLPLEDAAPALPSSKSEFPFRMPPPPPPAPLVVDSIDESYIETASLIAAAQFQPLSSFFGAVTAQEIVKITGKYTPIYQWFHLSSHDVLPNGADYTSDEYNPHESRYGHLISIFGKSFLTQLGNLKMFMVGCGALGCEDLKNFALCGMACGRRGSLVVTDNDRIEVSNLSRQFLFREENVGQPKSAAAGERMLQMNKDANVVSHQDFIGESTEHIYNSDFWDGVDVVVNALDNMEARLYVDKKCVQYFKVLVEAGTMGTGGNVDIIVPGKTASYADDGGADETGGIPMCTLRNFPYIYDHCIEWARAQFEDLFVSPMQAANQILCDPQGYVNRIKNEINAAHSDGEKRSMIEKNMQPLQRLLKTLIVLTEKPTMETCVKMSVEVLCKLFRDRIIDLQTAFPLDAVKKNGEPFWSGHRKYPNPLSVLPQELLSQKDSAEFLIACINLFASMFGIHPPKHEARFNDEKNVWMSEYRSKEWLSHMLESVSIPSYQPGEVEGLEDDMKPTDLVEEGSLQKQEEAVHDILHQLADLATNCNTANAGPLEFEKDDDQNFHIDFVAAGSNLRAENYCIPCQDKMKVKMVAGRIIPAVATTTSAVTGLSLIELFKVLQNKDVSCLRNGMIDVGTNNYVLFERDLPKKFNSHVTTTYMPEQDYTFRKKIICVPEGFTKYDVIPIKVTRTSTIKQFVDTLLVYLNATRGDDGAAYEIDGLGVGKGLIWNGRNSHPNTNLSLLTAIEEQKKNEAGGSLPFPFWEGRTRFFDLTVMISIDDEDDVDDVEVHCADICLRICDE